MSVSLSIIDAMNARGAIEKLLPQRLPFGLSLKLRRLDRELSAIIADYDAERLALLKRCAVTDDAGELMTDDKDAAQFATPADRIDFQKGHMDLLAQLVTVAHPIPAKAFDGLDLELGVVMALGDLLTETDA